MSEVFPQYDETYRYVGTRHRTTWDTRSWEMTGIMLMYICGRDHYKYGSLRRVYRKASKKSTPYLSLPLISPTTLRFDSPHFCVTSDIQLWRKASDGL